MVSTSRRSQRQRLNLWLNGTPVAQWDVNKGEHSLTYFDEWLSDEQVRPLSLSLPFKADNAPYRGDVVKNYFDNLLPDSEQIRRRMAAQFHTAGIAPHQLLAAVGRDCVGAIQLFPEDEQPQDLFSIQGKPLSEQEIAALLRRTTANNGSLGQREDDTDLRFSIAGAQEKTALLWHGNQWQFPLASTPTTHILKLPLGLVGAMQADMRTSVENEWLCSKIMAAFGIPIARCDIAQFEDQKVLVVERFDRKPAQNADWILRLPQEDLCQATGTSPLLKYQADGGPGISDIMEILLGSTQPTTDRHNFFKTQLVFWLLAATDGHAKNFSLAHLPESQFKATPVYDVLSAHPVIGTKANMIAPQRAKMAMAVRGSTNHYLIRQIRKNHWLHQANKVGLGAAAAEAIIEGLLQQLPHVIDAIYKQLPSDFPADLAEVITQGLQQHSRLLAENPAED